MIPLAVTAKNEAAAIGACLRSLLASAREAGVPFEVVAVLDDTTDATPDVVRTFPEVHVLRSSGGLVEAQRAAVKAFGAAAPFVVFSDADLHVEPGVLRGLVAAMRDDPHLRVAYPEKAPVPPRARTPLARALHTYNRTDGFQSPRRYFNGKLFAIRGWDVPTREELAPRIARLPPDPFYDFAAGMRVDDIYLSRRVWQESGPTAIREVKGAKVWFRPPETFEGMYRTYKRMRMEIERLDLLFPETRALHLAHGVRTQDLSRATLRERLDLAVFDAALAACKARYRAERAYHRRITRTPARAWDPVVESKQPITR